ncbi:MAG: hypothetical protein J3K34DRAFT_286932 [Monoraphidium minutum]|nr:MAG: hypothetical protein J3K34DRAFT_286932 [Monoraphidium minutum]
MILRPQPQQCYTYRVDNSAQHISGNGATVHGSLRLRAAPGAARHWRRRWRIAPTAAPAPAGPSAADAGLAAPTGMHQDNQKWGLQPPEQREDAPRVEHAAAAPAARPLPDALRAALPEVFPTMTAARKAVRRRRVRVDGALGACGDQIAAGQLLQVLAAPEGDTAGKRRPRPPPRGLEIPVLFDDDYMTAVIKPWGIKVHATWGGHHLAARRAAGRPPPRPPPRPAHGRCDAVRQDARRRRVADAAV